MGVSAVQSQMDYAVFAVAELEAMGCDVDAVQVGGFCVRPQIKVVNAAPLIDWLDRHQSVHVIEGLTPYWSQGHARFRECDVRWLIRNPGAQTSAPSNSKGAL